MSTQLFACNSACSLTLVNTVNAIMTTARYQLLRDKILQTNVPTLRWNNSKPSLRQAMYLLVFLLSVLMYATTATLAQNRSKPSTSASSKSKKQQQPAPQANTTTPFVFATESEAKAHLQFLASDELMGRATCSPGNDTAAAYIARHFQSLGLTPPDGMSSYFQPVPFVRLTPPSRSTMIIGSDTLTTNASLLTLFSKPVEGVFDAVYVGFGIVDSSSGRDDYHGVDVRGKIVIARLGESDSGNIMRSFRLSAAKVETAVARGAVGFVEVFPAATAFVWGRIVESRGGTSLRPANRFNDNINAFWARYEPNKLASFKGTFKVALSNPGTRIERVVSNNVLAVLRGTNPALRDEYVLLSAHYDHIGTAGRPGMQDSIFNGARDNGMGTTAVLCAATAFVRQPQARSILFAAWTGEEIGLLGSAYYAEHPVIPHNKVVFNLNCDGAGFNDTSLVTVIGLERTTAEPLIQQAALSQGLKAIPDPAPEQNLFDRSDNVSFAAKGIPAPTMAPGFTAFDAAIQKYYHQLIDEAGTDFDFAYLRRYVNTYIESARLIANMPTRPRWKAGDKYESAFKKLYGE